MDPGKPEFHSTQLKTISALRLHKLATIHSSSLARYLGFVDASTQHAVAGKLKDLLKL
jgi:mRNA-degrading endonuclease toxin of MazEF toxin-antitoxin module